MGVPASLSSVPDVSPYIQYVAAGGQTVYPYPFPITEDSDLVVVINGVTQATDSTYSVSGVGNATGGNATLNTGSTVGDIVTLYRDIPIERISQIAQNSGFSSTVFNNEFNNFYLIAQQLEAQIAQCLQLPNTNSPAPVTTLLPANYAGKYLAFDANGNPTPALLTTSGSLTQAIIAGLVFPQTSAEATAGVTPVDFHYLPGKVDRYKKNATPGTTSMVAGFQASVNQARGGPGGSDVSWGDTAPYMLDGVVDSTFGTSAQQYGITFRQTGTPGVNFPPSTSGGLYINHNQYTCFDLTGCAYFAFYDLTAVTNNGGTYPKTMFLTARAADSGDPESNFGRFFNTKVVGYFSVAILYNYASEDGTYYSNVWENYATDAGASCVVITANNLWQGNAAFMASNFVTIATGARSTIGHNFQGGDYALLNASTTGDVFYLEGGLRDFRFTSGWWDCDNSNGTTHGRSYLHMDTTNGAPINVKTDGIHGEIGNTEPSYGWDISATANTGSSYSINDCFMPTNTYAFHSPGTSFVVAQLYVTDMSENSTKGINIAGTVEDSTIDYEGILVLGTSLRNLLIGNFSNMTITTRTDDVIVDKGTGAVMTRGGVGMWGNGPAAQQTGWGTPTGGTVVNNFPGSAATLAQCGEALTEIILQLKALGLLGA